MLRRTFCRSQALRENLDKNINRPRTEPMTSWNNDTRYGVKEVKQGDPDPLVMHALRNKDKFSFRMFKARVISDASKAVFVLVSFGTGFFFLSPTLKKENAEEKGYGRMKLEGAEAMAQQSTAWWSNQWRQGAVGWRVGESDPNFYEPNFEFIKEVTGRDMLAVPQVPLSDADRSSAKAYHRKGMLKAFVPMCGDSPIVRVLADRGYFVHGVDCSEIAMQSLTKQIKIYLAKEKTWNLKLHWADLFDSELWSVGPRGLSDEQRKIRDGVERPQPLATDYTLDTNTMVMPPVEEGLKGEKFDLIYDRQAMSTFHPSARGNYTFLLKKAMKDESILFVEGIFRTGRVKGNKVKGPPYGLSEAQLSELFPSEEGFAVKCDTSVPDNLFSLDKANKLLGSIPKELYSTPIPCVVWKPAMHPARTKDMKVNL